MIDSLYIEQLEKKYVFYLKSIILGEPFCPIILRGGKTKPSTTLELHNMIRMFQANEKQKDGNGWHIEWEEWTSKKLGKQKWPSAITITSEPDFLFLIKKDTEVIAFKKQLELLLAWKPSIRGYLSNKPGLVLELKEVWIDICKVVDYLMLHSVSDHYLRSIPVPVHTKFIHQYKKIIHSILQFLDSDRFPSNGAELEEALSLNKKPFLFLLRWLDDGLSTTLTAGMQLFAVPVNYLRQQRWKIDRVILVENETNLYLLPSIRGTLVICSYGKALHLLKEIDFIKDSQLYYWGDMDEEGFHMLNDIRKYYDHVISLFMDEASLQFHKTELGIRAIKYKNKALPLLKPHESSAYEYLLSHNQWLEQERMQQAYVQSELQKLFLEG